MLECFVSQFYLIISIEHLNNFISLSEQVGCVHDSQKFDTM